MSLGEELRLVFVRSLKPPAGTDVLALRRFASDSWDSLAHMSLIVEIEEQFGVQLSVEDVTQIKDFRSAQDALLRLGVALDSGGACNVDPTVAVESEEP